MDFSILVYTSCLSYLEMVSNGPWTQKNNNFESITYSVKQRKHVFAGPKNILWSIHCIFKLYLNFAFSSI